MRVHIALDSLNVVQCNRIGNVGAVHLAHSLKRLPRLVGVNAGSNPFGAPGVRAFLQASHSKLEGIYLHSTCASGGQEVMPDLIDALQRYQGLESVSLPCQISGTAAKALGVALARMRNLSALAITTQDLSERCCAAAVATSPRLWPLVARLTGLTFLFLTGGMRIADLSLESLTRLQVRLATSAYLDEVFLFSHT